MLVKEVLKTNVAACAPDDDVAKAVGRMQERNCGFLPVVDSGGGLAGVITDRDIAMALGRHPYRQPTKIAVRDTMSRPVFSCFVDENLKVVLATMAKHHLRRLPVIDKVGHLQGVVSIDDIVLAPKRRGAPSAEEIVEHLRGIYARPTLEALPS
jgi:CBS domain-containing protein